MRLVVPVRHPGCCWWIAGALEGERVDVRLRLAELTKKVVETNGSPPSRQRDDPNGMPSFTVPAGLFVGAGNVPARRVLAPTAASLISALVVPVTEFT